MKKYGSLFLALVLFITTIPLNNIEIESGLINFILNEVNAENIVVSGSCGESLNYTITGDAATGYTLTISGNGPMRDFGDAPGEEVEDLDFIIYYTPWNIYSSNIKTINLSSGITYIGIGAFYELSNIESIDIPDSVTEIGSCAFFKCENLKSINIPNSVKKMGTYSFAWCGNLKNVNLSNNVTEIKDYLFSGCINLEEISIPYGIQNIGKGAFSACRSLEEIVIPNSVTTIGEGAFFTDNGIKRVVMSDNIQNIGDSTFCYCNNLTNISLPKSLQSIGSYAFSGCTNLTNIYLPNGLKRIDEEAFVNTEVTNIIVPKDVTYIGDYAIGYKINENDEYELDNRAVIYGNNSVVQSYAFSNNIKYLQNHGYILDKVDGFDSTCENSGVKLNYLCPHCNKHFAEPESLNELTEEELIIPKKNHKFTNYISNNDATCYKDGTKTAYCDYGCGATDKITISNSKVSHTYSNPVFSWSEDGSTCDVIFACTKVGCPDINEGHKASYAATITKSVKVAATCTTPGVTTYTASYGGYSDTKDVTDIPINPTNHGQVIVKNAIAPTCSAEGNTGDTYCSCCNKLISQGTVIAKTSHTTIVKNKRGATYFEKGYTGDNVCTLCGEVVEKGKATSVKKLSKVNLSSVKSKKAKQVSLNWKKNKYATGYEIQYSTDKNFIKGVKTIRISKNTTLSYKLKKLTSKKTVYFKIRAYKTGKVNKKSKTVYSAWSAVKNVKVK